MYTNNLTSNRIVKLLAEFQVAHDFHNLLLELEELQSNFFNSLEFHEYGEVDRWEVVVKACLANPELLQELTDFPTPEPSAKTLLRRTAIWLVWASYKSYIQEENKVLEEVYGSAYGEYLKLMMITKPKIWQAQYMTFPAGWYNYQNDLQLTFITLLSIYAAKEYNQYCTPKIYFKVQQLTTQKSPFIIAYLGVLILKDKRVDESLRYAIHDLEEEVEDHELAEDIKKLDELEKQRGESIDIMTAFSDFEHLQ